MSCVPARMNEKVTQVPATALTIVLSDILVFSMDRLQELDCVEKKGEQRCAIEMQRRNINKPSNNINIGTFATSNAFPVPGAPRLRVVQARSDRPVPGMTIGSPCPLCVPI
jgi:hypothetical protein